MVATATINQVTQIGVESTPGQSPGSGSNRLLRHLMYQIDTEFAYKMYRGGGRRFNSIMAPLQDWSKYKVSGPVSYTEINYPLAGLLGTPVVTTPSNGVNARQLSYGALLSGNQGGVTYQGQNGDSIRVRQWNYMKQTGLELQFKRNGEAVISGGDGFGAQTQPNATFTSTPTSRTQAPAPPVQFSVYLDGTSAGLGVTKIGKAVEAQFKTTGWNAAVWYLDDALPSFGDVVDTPPATTCMLRVIPDGNIDDWWVEARAAQTCYIRLQGNGNPVDNRYSINGDTAYTAGTFTLTYKGQTTAPIARTATGAQIQAALEALTTIGTGGASVDNSATAFNTVTTFHITFNNARATDPSLLTANFAGLTGGSPALTNITVKNQLRLDMAAKYVPQQFSDDGGAYLQDWLFEVVEDTSWVTAVTPNGTALYVHSICDMTGL